MDNEDLVSLTSGIVAAYVAGNHVQVNDLPGLVASVHKALANAGEASSQPEPVALVPAVPVRRSITPEFLICLEDGRKMKSLKRHLQTKFDLSPEAYRAKWGLPRDYPMVAPAYAEARSKLAKAMGLGAKGRHARAPTPAPAKRNPDFQEDAPRAPKAAKTPPAKATAAKKAPAKKAPTKPADQAAG